MWAIVSGLQWIEGVNLPFYYDYNKLYNMIKFAIYYVF